MSAKATVPAREQGPRIVGVNAQAPRRGCRSVEAEGKTSAVAVAVAAACARAAAVVAASGVAVVAVVAAAVAVGGAPISGSSMTSFFLVT